MINKILSTVFLNALVVYIVIKYIPVLWFTIDMGDTFNLEIFLIIWAVFWFTNDILKWFLKIIALPITFVTLGLFSIVINIVIFYIFKSVVNSLDLWIVVWLGTVLQVFFLSIVTGILNLLIKKL